MYNKYESWREDECFIYFGLGSPILGGVTATARGNHYCGHITDPLPSGPGQAPYYLQCLETKHQTKQTESEQNIPPQFSISD